jgi:hypothetical protein
MAITISTAATRANKRGSIKGCILGPSGIGKTSQLWTLNPKTTLFVDIEAGGLSVEKWEGDRIDVFQEAQKLDWPIWEVLRGLACWLGGPSPMALDDSQPYSKAHYAAMCSDAHFGPPGALDKYENIFIDSITVASRACLTWAKTQPRSFSEKTGKPDMRGSYGVLKEEMVAWLTQIQHVQDRNVWMVGILDKSTDDFGRSVWAPQIEGTGTINALPGIFDQLISMVEITPDGGGDKYRAFVCHTLNQWGYPAKDRSSVLDVLEPPSLGALMDKIRSAPPSNPSLVLSMPAGSAVEAVKS